VGKKMAKRSNRKIIRAIEENKKLLGDRNWGELAKEELNERGAKTGH